MARLGSFLWMELQFLRKQLTKKIGPSAEEVVEDDDMFGLRAQRIQLSDFSSSTDKEPLNYTAGEQWYKYI